jgi:6-pyruvoyltetrahydropterin/6-carboxytetrahydropterin synthase
MAVIIKIFYFEAAHQLAGHKGACARPHGHSYKLEVILEGPIKSATSGESDAGFVTDFGDISDAVKPIIAEHLDHFDLNKTIGPDRSSDPLMRNTRVARTTAELIACWIFGSIKSRLKANYTEMRIRLWETTTGYVEVGSIDWIRVHSPGLK